MHGQVTNGVWTSALTSVHMLLLLPRHTRSFVQLLCLRVQEGLMLMADEVYQENIYCDKPFVCKLLAR